MKFTRRPDLAPQTRIDIVMLAWLHQGVYGKMTAIAQSYQISRTFLYHLLLMANLQLETLFSEEKPLFQKDHRHVEHIALVVTVRRKMLASEDCCDFEGTGILTPIPWDISVNSSTVLLRRCLPPS